ncbi:MAG TPA: hypothetical protein VK986_24090, partial [Tepidisphaeraceae bacterium]|nr:hypothetical protein [Tepidisphaeraceae bacterium]
PAWSNELRLAALGTTFTLTYRFGTGRRTIDALQEMGWMAKPAARIGQGAAKSAPASKRAKVGISFLVGGAAAIVASYFVNEQFRNDWVSVPLLIVGLLALVVGKTLFTTR